MADSRRSNVVRNEFPSDIKAAGRVFTHDILCCVNQSGTTTDGGAGQVCILDEIIIDTDFRRVFLSASLTGYYANDPDQLSGGMFITEQNFGIVLIPRLTVDRPGCYAITSAIDLGVGTYQFKLMISSSVYGVEVGCGEASLQAIMGQVVDEQQCFRTGGCGG